MRGGGFFNRTGPEPDNPFKAFMRVLVVVAIIATVIAFATRCKAENTNKSPAPTVTGTP